MEKILISGCLVGQQVRYHGKDALCKEALLSKWQDEGRLVPICPEVSAGLPVPRPSCEIVGRGGGKAVLRGNAKVMSHNGIDRTEAFISGARNALALAKKWNIHIAILKTNSPSCGNNSIYDGTYSGRVIPGSGVTAALLAENGVAIFNEKQLTEVDALLRQLT